MAPPLTPRPRPTYDNSQHGQSRSGGVGQFLIKPGADVMVKKPSWEGKETVFRPFPCLSYDDPMNAFEPYRRDPGGKNAFSDWIRRYDVAWGVGNPPCTFILNDPTKCEGMT